MIVAVDFDGICVSNEYPSIGENIGAADVLRKIIDSGNDLILWTHRFNTYKHNNFMQSVVDEHHLDDAVNWFKNREIPLLGINENPNQSKEDAKHKGRGYQWSGSKMVYADVVINYYGIGVPLKFDYKISDLPIADWQKIESWLTDMKIIKPPKKADTLGGFSF